jgi:hypothetical protein
MKRHGSLPHGHDASTARYQLGGGFGSDGGLPGTGPGLGGSGLGMGRGALGGVPCGLGWLITITSSATGISVNQVSNKAVVKGEFGMPSPSMTLK